MKLKHWIFAPLALFAGAPVFGVDVIFVDEDFESYGSQGAFETEWVPEAGDGFSGGAGGSASLVTSGIPGQQGNVATGVSGQINEQKDGWHPAFNPSGYLLSPSADQSIVLRGDIFAFQDQANALAGDVSFRQTLGLRSDIFDRDPDPGINAAGVNFIELGFYNTTGCIPTNPTCSGGDPGDPDADPPIPPTDPDPEFVPNRDFQFRLVLFDSSTIGEFKLNGVSQGIPSQSPSWLSFPLDDALDLSSTVLPNGNVGNEDGTVNLLDIGDGWHTYEAVISDTSVTLSLDLYRDGINNVTGAAGVDATVEFEIQMAAAQNDPPFDYDPAPMNSLRIGGPSGVDSAHGLAHFDNIYLALEDVEIVDPGLPGDANGDGKVDILDLDILSGNFGTMGGATVATGDFNGDGNVDILDLDILSGNFGTMASVSASVPEPMAWGLMAIGSSLLLGRRRTA